MSFDGGPSFDIKTASKIVVLGHLDMLVRDTKNIVDRWSELIRERPEAMGWLAEVLSNGIRRH